MNTDSLLEHNFVNEIELNIKKNLNKLMIDATIVSFVNFSQNEGDKSRNQA